MKRFLFSFGINDAYYLPRILLRSDRFEANLRFKYDFVKVKIYLENGMTDIN